jgi:hypothetical protein
MVRTSYENLCVLFKSKGCDLITTKQEYDDKHMVKQDKFKYIAKCGHQHSVSVTNFMKNSGIYCSSCANKKRLEKIKECHRETTTKVITVREIADLFNSFIKEIDIERELEFKLTGDKYSYCDFYYRHKSDLSGKWLRIQVTYSNTSKIEFHVNRRNNKKFIIFGIVPSNGYWIIPDDKITVSRIAISDKKGTKYDNFKIENKDILSKLKQYFYAYKDTDIEETSLALKANNFESFDYTTISRIITDHKCKLLTTSTEFVERKLNSKSSLRIEMSCGHISNCSVNSLQKRQHKNCRECILDKIKSNAYDDEERVSRGSKQEATVFKQISTFIIEKFMVIKAHEGCRADMLVKPINKEQDEWIGIQLECFYFMAWDTSFCPMKPI